jgi:hypothetical protein
MTDMKMQKKRLQMHENKRLVNFIDRFSNVGLYLLAK